MKYRECVRGGGDILFGHSVQPFLRSTVTQDNLFMKNYMTLVISQVQLNQ